MTRKLRTDPSRRAPAPAGMLERVVRDGRRRRRIAATTGSSLLAVAAAAVALTSVASGSTASLRPLPPADGSVAPSATPSASPSAGVAPTPGESALPTPPSPEPSSVTETHPASDPSPTPSPSPKYASVTRTYVQYGAVCTGDNSGVGGDTSGVSTADWCVTAAVSGSSTPTFVLQICRDPAHGAADLTYATSQVVDYTVRDTSTGNALWTWSAGRTFSSPAPSLHFAAGDCYQWSTLWDGRADDGSTVKAGTGLSLEARSTSSELGHKVATDTFTR